MSQKNKQTKVPNTFFIFVILAALLSQSGLVMSMTIGSLSYDADVNASIISDSRNNRDWLRWDELTGNTLEETRALTQGAYQGWSIANSLDAQLFIEALLPADRATTCTAYSSEGCWTDRDVTRDYHELVGDTFTTGSGTDLVFFESHKPDWAGYIMTRQDRALKTVEKKSEFDRIDNANRFVDSCEGTGWLLYRDWPVDSIEVNEPSSLFFSLFPLLGLYRFGRKH